MRATKKILITIGVVTVVCLAIGLYLWSAAQSAIRHAKVTKAKLDLESIQSSLIAYHSEYGTYPIGSASDILDELTGNNPRRLRFLDLSPERPLPIGDPWGEAYLAFPGSQTQYPEFYSKGPDRVDDQCSSSSDDIRFGAP